MQELNVETSKYAAKITTLSKDIANSITKFDFPLKNSEGKVDDFVPEKSHYASYNMKVSSSTNKGNVRVTSQTKRKLNEVQPPQDDGKNDAFLYTHHGLDGILFLLLQAKSAVSALSDDIYFVKRLRSTLMRILVHFGGD
jgi:hypothetical protein